MKNPKNIAQKENFQPIKFMKTNKSHIKHYYATVSMLEGIYYDQAGFISGMQDWLFTWKFIDIIHYTIVIVDRSKEKNHNYYQTC